MQKYVEITLKKEPLLAGLFHPQSAFMPSTNPFIDYLNFHLSSSSYASDAEWCVMPVLSCLGFMSTELWNRPKYVGLS